MIEKDQMAPLSAYLNYVKEVRPYVLWLSLYGEVRKVGSVRKQRTGEGSRCKGGKGDESGD